MFADFRPLRKHSEPHCQRSIPPVQGKTQPPSSELTKIGSTLSPEEHQPCIRPVRLSQGNQLSGAAWFVNEKRSFFAIWLLETWIIETTHKVAEVTRHFTLAPLISLELNIGE
jgi:hypothetical protein